MGRTQQYFPRPLSPHIRTSTFYAGLSDPDKNCLTFSEQHIICITIQKCLAIDYFSVAKKT
jgi:hypothetical protein